MELISTSIYVILFIFLLVFIFSMAVLSPYLEKKDIAGVLVIAFIIGAIGGLFFIGPIYEDFPEFVGQVDAIVTGEDQYINIDVSSQYELNVSEIINKTKSTEGVHSVNPSKITLVTGNFSSDYAQYMKTGIEQNINVSSNVSNVSIDSANGVINVSVKNNSDPVYIEEDISVYLQESYDLTPSSYVIRLQAGVNPLDIDTVSERLKNQSIPVSTVEGSITNNTQKAESQQQPISVVSIVCGLIGVLSAVIGIFADNIYNKWKRMGSKRRDIKVKRNFSNKKSKEKDKDENNKEKEKDEEVFEEGIHKVEPNPQKDIKIDKKDSNKSVIFKKKDDDFDELNKKSKEKTLDDFKK